MSEFYRALEKALHAIPSVSNVSVDQGDSWESEVIDLGEGGEIEPLSQSRSVIPEHNHLEIHFDAFISTQLQASLLQEDPDSLSTGSEHFHVSLFDSYRGFLIASIEPISPSRDCSPSQSVRIMREFLENEIAKQKCPIRFDYLGPSPFHADFFVYHKEPGDDRQDVEVSHRQQTGYDRYDITVSASASEIPGLTCHLFRSIADELEIFYTTVQIKNRLMAAWVHVVDSLLEFQAIHEARTNNPIRWFTKRRRIARMLAELAIEIATFENERLFEKLEIAKGMRHVERSVDLRQLFTERTRVEKEDIDGIDLSHTAKAIEFFERRRQSDVRNLTSIAMGLVGAAIGASATIFFGPSLTQSQTTEADSAATQSLDLPPAQVHQQEGVQSPQ